MNKRLKGFILLIVGSVLWGTMGVVVQYLLENKQFDPAWITSARLTAAGFILLVVDKILNGSKIMAIWNKRDAANILVFSVFGMIGTQFCYIEAIHYSNAATATILQYLMPVIILVYLLFKEKRGPMFKESLCLSMAVIGTFLLITKGHFDSLAISPAALFWGLLSAVAAAVYTLQPRRMLKRYSSAYVVGWGMLGGGILLSFYRSPFQFTGVMDMEAIFALSFVIVFCTVISFWGYVESTKYLYPTEVGTLSSIEPFSAVLLTIMCLNVSFGVAEIIGGLLILSTIFIIARK